MCRSDGPVGEHQYPLSILKTGFPGYTGQMEYATETLSVSQLNRRLKSLIEPNFASLSVEGEISNLRPSSTGHYYFTLKDNDSTISSVMFKNRLGGLQFIPGDGDRVRVRGKLSVYEPRGTYQIICESMERCGEGEILAMLEERKKQLAREGIFDSDRKRTLPLFPKRIGVVTSPTGAAIRDLLQVTRKRIPGTDIVIFPCSVQGADAASEIVRAINWAATTPGLELVVVTRGGGSVEDLLPFSDIAVVHAVAGSPVPTISAVGHEIDTALCDLAADCVAPTPSAAGEMISPDRMELAARVSVAKERIGGTLKNQIERIRLLSQRFQPKQMDTQMQPVIQNRRMRISDSMDLLNTKINAIITRHRHSIDLFRTSIMGASPTETLKRGYALVWSAGDGGIVIDPTMALPGTGIVVEMERGRIHARVESSDRGSNISKGEK